MLRCIQSLLALGSSALLLSGCVSSDRGLPLQTAQEVNRLRSVNLRAEYKLGPADEVALAVYGEPELSKTYKIGPDGAIEVPLVGRIPAAGLTIEGLSATIQTQLASRYLQNPSVVGNIIAYRPFYILGEVSKSGQYPYSVGMTLEGAVALAEGYSYRARTDYVFIQSEDQDEEVRVQVTPGLIIRPGDRIRVAERFF
jgi:protein involved in polysaccharide export with SLBB domain